MASNKNTNANNILAVSALSGKTFTGLNVFRHGIVTVIEILFSGGSQFIKVGKGGMVEVGGDHDLGTGTSVSVN